MYQHAGRKGILKLGEALLCMHTGSAPASDLKGVAAAYVEYAFHHFDFVLEVGEIGFRDRTTSSPLSQG